MLTLSIEEIYRRCSRAVFARLVVEFKDFDLAEDALQEAFAAAVKQWPADGVPNVPEAWLYRTARFCAIDAIRKKSRLQPLPEEDRPGTIETESEFTVEEVSDELLRLIFTCCHPAISPDAQIALTLREVCDLTTEEIASAFLTQPSTVAQRIVRAKQKIREAKIPFDAPSKEELPHRLPPVLKTVYLVFNEGYNASSGAVALRTDLSKEAIRLGRLLVTALPSPHTKGLLALMLFHESRSVARTGSSGEIVRLEDQDRSRWDQEMITDADGLVRESLAEGLPNTYSLQAAIAGVHAAAIAAEETDWNEILGLYELLYRLEPTPVVALNRIVAASKVHGALHALEALNALLNESDLQNYHLAHVAKGEFCLQLRRLSEAKEAFQNALQHTDQAPEIRLIQTRLDGL